MKVIKKLLFVYFTNQPLLLLILVKCMLVMNQVFLALHHFKKVNFVEPQSIKKKFQLVILIKIYGIFNFLGKLLPIEVKENQHFELLE